MTPFNIKLKQTKYPYFLCMSKRHKTTVVNLI